jgi:hypothetical protein
MTGKEAMPLGDLLAWFCNAMQAVARITSAATIHAHGHSISSAISQNLH